MTESEVQQQIQIAAVSFNCILMRNNSGTLKREDGTPVRFGLGNISKNHSDAIKSSDLIGFKVVTVTPEMVGMKLAVFTAIEVKAYPWKPNARDPRERAQLAFLDWIQNNGGYAGFADSVDGFRRAIGR